MQTMVQIIDAGEKAREEQMRWIETMKSIDKVSRDAYEDGYAEGWRSAVAHLKAKGDIAPADRL